MVEGRSGDSAFVYARGTDFGYCRDGLAQADPGLLHKTKREACQEPDNLRLVRREAAIGGAGFPAAPQERHLKARNRGRPRADGIRCHLLREGSKPNGRNPTKPGFGSREPGLPKPLLHHSAQARRPMAQGGAPKTLDSCPLTSILKRPLKRTNSRPFKDW